MRKIGTLFVFALLMPLAGIVSAATVSPPRGLGDAPLLQAVRDQVRPVAVSNGEDYLVVYYHDGPTRQLRATRVTAGGEALDHPFGFEIGHTDLFRPFDVVWTGSHYLVGWTSEDCENLAPCFQLTMVSSDGSVEHGASFPIVWGVHFALRNDRLLLVWSDQEGLKSILASPDGAIIHSTILVETDRFPDIARVVATDSGFLVFAEVYKERLLVVPVSDDGEGGEVSVLAERSELQTSLSYGSIATNGHVSIVFYGDRHGVQNFASLGPDGSLLTRREPFEPYPAGDTQILPDGSDFLMVTRGNGINLRTLTAEGETGPPWSLQPELSPDGSRLRALSGSAASILLLWEAVKGDGFWEPGGKNQYFRAYDRALQPLTPAMPLMFSAPLQRFSAVAASGDVYLHVWEEYRDGIWQIYSQPRTSDGEALAWPIDHPYGSFYLTSNGDTFLLAISRVRAGDGFLDRYPEVRLLDRSGAVLMTRELPLSGLPKAVAWDGRRYVLLWDERLPERYPDVGMLSVLSSELEPETTVELGDFADGVGFDGGVYVLDEIEGPKPFPDALPTLGLGVRVVSTGESVTVGPRTTIVEPSVEPGLNVLHWSIASNRSEALLYWQQHESSFEAGGFREVSALLSRAGNIIAQVRGDLDANGATAAEAMTWDGRHWESVRNGGGELLVQVLDRSGAFGERISIPIESYGFATASIASGRDGRAVVDYSAFVTNEKVGVGVERVLTRTITSDSPRRHPVRRSER